MSYAMLPKGKEWVTPAVTRHKIEKEGN